MEMWRSKSAAGARGRQQRHGVSSWQDNERDVESTPTASTSTRSSGRALLAPVFYSNNMAKMIHVCLWKKTW